MNYKKFTMVVLCISLLIITGCKTKNESKKARSTQSSEQAGNISKPGQNISIHEAALNGQSADVMRILAEGADINAKDEDGRTALMYAAYNGHKEIMEKLIPD